MNATDATSMRHGLRRRRLTSLVALAALGFAVLAGATVRVLTSQATSACTLAPPQPSLSAQLRSLGDFDQPYDTGDPRVLTDAALRAATAQHSDLTGTVAQPPVLIAPAGVARYDALVVPLKTQPPSSAPAVISGLVSFLRDCAGRAWYSGTIHLRDTGTTPPTPAWPSLDAATARADLGGTAVRLVYTASPFSPAWQDGAGHSLPAA